MMLRPQNEVNSQDSGNEMTIDEGNDNKTGMGMQIRPHFSNNFPGMNQGNFRPNHPGFSNPHPSMSGNLPGKFPPNMAGGFNSNPNFNMNMMRFPPGHNNWNNVGGMNQNNK